MKHCILSHTETHYGQKGNKHKESLSMDRKKKPATETKKLLQWTIKGVQCCGK